MQGNSLLKRIWKGIKLFDEKLLNIKLPDKKNKISEVENDIKIIEKTVNILHRKSKVDEKS